MKIFVIALNSLRRLFRDRIALFFILLLPVMIIFLIGIAIFGAGGGATTAQVGVLSEGSGPLGAQLVSTLKKDKSLTLTSYESAATLRKDIRRETMDAGLIIPEGYDEKLRAGTNVELKFLSPTADPAPTIRSVVASALSDQGAKVRAAIFASSNGAGSFDENLERAEDLSTQGQRVTVASRLLGTKKEDSTTPTGFRYPAASNLVLFVFISSLAGASQLIETRQLGISRRMLGTPTSGSTILFGEALGRFVIAGFQGLFIFAVGAVVFGVTWGDPLGTAALILSFCLVATGVSMLAGTIFRTAEQAGAVGPPVGIALGMLGGCMWPLEIVPRTMRAIGHITPQAWAMDGFIDLIVRGEGLAGIIPQLAVLLGVAAVLLPLASWRLRRSIVV
jgi:ABC-2 type transport system permease protein